MIITSSKVDAKRSINAVVLGFCTDPIMRWLYPEPQDYLKTFPVITQLYGGRAYDHGSAYHVEGYLGSALWLPPNVHPDGDGLVSLLEESLDKTVLEDAFSLLDQMERFHPNEPCWHLAFIAVDPAQQGKGLTGRQEVPEEIAGAESTHGDGEKQQRARACPELRRLRQAVQNRVPAKGERQVNQ